MQALPEPAARERRRSDDRCSRWVCFDLGGQRYGLPILQVQEVLAAAVIEPVPGGEPSLLGVINLRGNVATVIDLRRCLELPPRDDTAPAPVIVVNYGAEQVGLQVDRVADVRKLADAAIKPAPDAGTAARTGQVQGIISRGGELLTLLDVDQVVRHARLVAAEPDPATSAKC